ncbi:nuclear transport factor 2 family protein [Saccharothrix syringae]|uniref:Nuclear transport factor 2 family protein n=1 Tax=Saccharothrix syringae TaxID=103733 RepID=A0A5Q0GWU7_SACSY|nr:nuclear transport factor 2 family protein [Saccharothrix syringae]QFZ18411.1 nuclear transport factor 2 family protein [Saccharothrix syringae]
MTTPEPAAALEPAREFVRAVEAKDLDAVAATLAPDVRQLFVHSRRTRTPDGVADVIAGRGKGICVADLRGRAEVLAYTGALFDKFTPLAWRDHGWTASARGIFFCGKGDMVVARTGKPYRNSYVTRFDVEGGGIVRMVEHADAFLYAGLRVRPNGVEFRALLRAVGRLLPPVGSSRSGG